MFQNNGQKRQPWLILNVEGNYGNFSNVRSFHSFTPIMEESDIKRKIIRGAESLFMKYGVRSISMDDIARHLSVSKKTLYQHFEDKEDIVTIDVSVSYRSDVTGIRTDKDHFGQRD